MFHEEFLHDLAFGNVIRAAVRFYAYPWHDRQLRDKNKRLTGRHTTNVDQTR